MPKLYVVRHAEPALRGVFLGQLDPPLSGAGRARAREALAGLRVAVVFSSPLRRALQTAAAINAPLRVVPELAELSLGEWQGKSWAEVEAADAGLARRKQHDWLSEAPAGGESWDAFTERVARALDQVRQGPFPAAVVAHAGVNSAVAQLLTGQDPRAFHQEYCEVLEYEI